MATLQKIRNKAGILVAVIGIAMLAFIVGDFLSSGSTFFHMSNDKVAVVNGTRITVSEFQARVNKTIEEEQMRYRNQYGTSLPDNKSAQINKEVYDRMVSELVVKDVAENIGLAVSEAEMVELLTGDYMSPQVKQLFANPQTGVVDQNQVKSFVQYIFSDDQAEYSEEQIMQIERQRAMWLDLEKSVKEERIASKLFTLIQKSIQANELDLIAAFDESTKTVNIAYTSKLYNTIPDSAVVVTESDIRKEYNKTKEIYKTDGEVELKYLSIDIKPTEEDYKLTEAKINELQPQFSTTNDVTAVLTLNTDIPYTNVFETISKMDNSMKTFASKASKNEVKGPFVENGAYKMYRLMDKNVSPDSVNVRHIMLAQGQEALLDSIYTVLTKKRGDFAKLAEQYSIDRNTSSNGGEIGWMREPMGTQLGEAFVDACFRGKTKGAMKVTSDVGIHIVEVTDKTKPVEKAKVAQCVMTVRASSKTEGILYNKLSQYIAVNKDLASFEAGDADNNLVVQTANLTPNSISVNNVSNAREIVRWAFNTDKGKVSDIFSVDNKFVVAMVANKLDAGYLSQTKVEPTIKQKLIRDKKAEMLIASLNGVEGGLKDYSKLLNNKVDSAAQVSFKNPVVKGLGFEPKVVGAAMAAEVGKVQSPIAGERGVFVIEVTSENETNSSYNKESERAIYNQQAQQILYSQFLQYLNSSAEIENNRIKFF